MASKLPSETNSKRVGSQCAAYGCNNYVTAGVGMYKFPKDAKRRRQWVLQVQRTRADFVEVKNKWVSLCGDHFTQDQFDSSVDRQLAMGFRAKCLGRSLLKTAIPTQFVRPATVSGLRSPPKPRKTSAIEKRHGYNIIHELLLQSESNSAPTVATSTSTTSASESALFWSEPEPEIEMESFAEVKLELIEEEEILTKANMQDFSCQFSGVTMEDVSCQFSGKTTQDFSCQFPEDRLLLTENNQLPRSETFTSENLNSSLTEQDYYSDGDENSEPDDGDEDFEPDDECEGTESESDDEYDDRESDISPMKEVQASSPIPPFDQRSEERKFMVFESQLRTLFDLCFYCRSKNTRIIFKVTGSSLLVEQKCLDCDRDWEWKSQPYIKKQAVGNILLSAGILSSGLSPKKVVRLMQTIGLCSISLRTYTRHQLKILFQAVDDVWSEKQREKVMERVFALVETQEDDSLDDLHASALQGRPRVPPPMCSTYYHPDKRKAVEEKVTRFKKPKQNN